MRDGRSRLDGRGDRRRGDRRPGGNHVEEVDTGIQEISDAADVSASTEEQTASPQVTKSVQSLSEEADELRRPLR